MLHETDYTEIKLTKDVKDSTSYGKIEISFIYLKDYKRVQFFASCVESFIVRRAISLFKDCSVFNQDCGIVVYVKNELDFARTTKLIAFILEAEEIFNKRLQRRAVC